PTYSSISSRNSFFHPRPILSISRCIPTISAFCSWCKSNMTSRTMFRKNSCAPCADGFPGDADIVSTGDPSS
ncbi:unnamed protein product, partial [Mycena citricolor]